MSELQTARVNSTARPTTKVSLPLVLLADHDVVSRTRRAAQLIARGIRVALARTSFEAIVKASCHLPDMILVDSSLGRDVADETARLLAGCPATAHIPIVRLSGGRRLPARVFALAR